MRVKNALKSTLFDASRPRRFECPGSQLSAKLADLKRRGAVILGMTCARPGSYTLALDWPDTTPGTKP
jgi:hypothetical protein